MCQPHSRLDGGGSHEIIETLSSLATLCFLELDGLARAYTLEDSLMELANEPVYEKGVVGGVKSWLDGVGGGAKSNPTTDEGGGCTATLGVGFEPDGLAPAVSLLEFSLSLLDDTVGGS